MAIPKLTFSDKYDGVYLYGRECNSIKSAINALITQAQTLNIGMDISRLGFPDKATNEFFYPGECNDIRDRINQLIGAYDELTQAAEAPGTVTYTASSTYVARCGTDKEGTGSSVSRTANGISTISQADADAKAAANAKAAAVAALVCTVVVAPPPPPTVYTGSYTARCGTDKTGTGADVTRTAEGATQAEADAAARNAAIAALVCTVANAIPVANAGSDTTLQLPTNQAVLQGSGTDTDGTIASYAWRQVTGPSIATGLPTMSASVVVGNLVEGIYQFGLKTTDNQGAVSPEDMVIVTVQAAPSATLVAGLTLPSGNTTTVGTALAYQATASGGTGPYQLLVKAENTATGVVTQVYSGSGASYSGSWTPTTAGDYSLTNTVTDNAGTQKISTSRPVTVNAASADPVVYTAKSSDFHNNAYDESISGTMARRRSALAYVTHQFSNGLPAYADIRFVAPVHGTTSPSSQVGIAVLTDGNYTGMATATSKAEQTVRLTFSVTSGSHTLTFGEGLQEELSNLNFAGCHILDITYPANTAYTVVAPDLSKPPFFFGSDSTGVGVGATVAQTHALISQLQQYFSTYRCIALGAGRCRIDTSFDTLGKRTTQLDRMATCGGNMSGAAYALIMTYNDAGSGGTVANSSAVAGTWFDAIKGRFPSMVLAFQTALPSTNDAAFKLPEWRAALAKVANDKGVKVIDGFILLDNPAQGQDTVDGIHPGSAATAAKYAPRWFSGYNAKATLAQPVLLHAWEGTNTGARWEDQGTGGNHALQAATSRQPTFVDNAVFGRKAAYFSQSTLQFMQINPLAQQSGEYTIIFTCRSTSAQRSQFIFDVELGRIASYAKGLDADQSGYYSAATGGTLSGVRGVRFNADSDTFVAIALGSTDSEMTINDNVISGIAAGVTRFQSAMRIGAAIDNIEGGSLLGRFYGYIGAIEVWPGKLTAEQVQVRRAVIAPGGSTGSTQNVLIEQSEATTPNGVTRTETNATLYSGGTGIVLSQLNQTVVFPTRTMTGFQLVSPKANGVGHVLVTMRDSSGNVVHQVSVDISQAASTPTNSAVVYTSPTFASAAYTITCQIDPAYPSAIFVDAIIANGVPV